MPKKLAAVALSFGLLLASCAPATVQTPNGPATIQVIGGVGYTLTDKLPLEQMTEATPDSKAITFTGCQGGAIRAWDVRRYGAEAALAACQKAIDRAASIQKVSSAVQIVLLPILLVVVYYVNKFFSCFKIDYICSP